MKTVLLSTLFALALLSGCATADSIEQAWEDFKLRYFSLTRMLHDQDKVLSDIADRGVDPAEHARIELDELRDGGPPKDGIPSIDQPRFVPAKQSPFGDDARVLGVQINGDARAYPYGILNWHEVVNDTVGGVPVTVTYCPLCDTGIVFERGEATYGVSGKLYQSCQVMYSRETQSLFAQPWGLGIVGEEVDRSLPRLPAVKTTLGAWRERHPETRVLSVETGYDRDYFEYPYGSYEDNRELIFPVRHRDRLEHHPKAIISYVWQPGTATPSNAFGGDSAQVLHDTVQKQETVPIELAGRALIARWDHKLQTVVVIDDRTEEVVPSATAFAFVYPAFFGEQAE